MQIATSRLLLVYYYYQQQPKVLQTEQILVQTPTSRLLDSQNYSSVSFELSSIPLPSSIPQSSRFSPTPFACFLCKLMISSFSPCTILRVVLCACTWNEPAYCCKITQLFSGATSYSLSFKKIVRSKIFYWLYTLFYYFFLYM